MLGAAWAEWDRAYEAILDLEENTPRLAALRANMLTSIHGISESRDRRAAQAIQRIDAMFWFAAASGLVLASMAYFSFPPKPVLCLRDSQARVFRFFGDLVLYEVGGAAS